MESLRTTKDVGGNSNLVMKLNFVSIVNILTLCIEAYFMTLFRSFGLTEPWRLKSRLRKEIESSRLNRTQDTNFLKLFSLLKCEELNARLVRRFQRSFSSLLSLPLHLHHQLPLSSFSYPYIAQNSCSNISSIDIIEKFA